MGLSSNAHTYGCGLSNVAKSTGANTSYLLKYGNLRFKVPISRSLKNFTEPRQCHPPTTKINPGILMISTNGK